NGYKIPAYSITELMGFLHEFRDHANAHIDTIQMKRVVATATLKHDQDLLEGKEIQTDYLIPSIFEFNDAVSEAAKEPLRRSPEYDYGMELVVFPSEKHHLVLLYSEKSESIFAEYPEVEEYGYWDNTDRPDGIKA